MPPPRPARYAPAPLLPLLLVLALPAGCTPRSDDAPAAQILSHAPIYQDPDVYAAWPSLVRAADGDLLLAFTSTERHVSPDGAIVLMRSADNGLTWSGPDTLFDTVIDDRESGFTAMPDGALIAHLWSTHWTRTAYAESYGGSYPDSVLARWMEDVDRPPYRNADSLHGGWAIVSRDDGRTWGAPQRGPDSIHGGTALAGGGVLVASYRTHAGDIGVYTAPGPDGPWTHIQTVACPRPDSLRFGEPHVLQLPSGRILMMIRATARPYNDRNPRLVLWETYSDDGGQTWADPFETPLWGFPPHLTLLHDGRVLVTYGYRRAPYGQRAAISEDGVTWDSTSVLVLRDDAPDGDLGYPASLEIAPDTVLTVYYQKPSAAASGDDRHAHKVDIVGTRWVVPRAGE